MSERISIREFARRVGCSDVAVLKAIKTEKIVKAIDYSNPKRPKIDPEIALEEWGKNYDPNHQRTDKIHENMAQQVPVREKSKPKAKVEKPTPSVVVEPTIPKVENGRSLAEVKRQTAEVKLHLAALELKEKRGELVDKHKVYKALFSAGQEVRSSLQSLADRVIDDILAARSRNEAHSVLFNAISDELEKLSTVLNNDLNV